MTDTCDKCGDEPHRGDLHESSIKGIDGTYCQWCLRNAPGFCERCWSWSKNHMDGACVKCGHPVVCQDCGAIWNLYFDKVQRSQFFHPGHPGRIGGRPEDAIPPEPPHYECPACGSHEEPIYLDQLSDVREEFKHDHSEHPDERELP